MKGSTFVKMSIVATVENATPIPRQMIAKKYFNISIGPTPSLDAVICHRCHALSTKALAARKDAAPGMAAVLTSREDHHRGHQTQLTALADPATAPMFVASTRRQTFKAKTPVAKIAKLTKRSEGSLRQKAQKLGIRLGHRR